MARPARPWFRFYTEAFADRKLLRLTPAQRWLWVALLGAARESCEPGRLLVTTAEPMTAREIARYADVPEGDVWPALEAMRRYGMVTWDDAGTVAVCNWESRQFESDNTAVRTAKHRSQERSKEQPNDGGGNGSDTETDTEKKPLARKRAKDPVFDALVEVCQINPAELTASARGALNTARKGLVDIGASDEDVRRKAEAYRVQFPSAVLTPTALAKHWPALNGVAPKPARPSGPEPSVRMGRNGQTERFFPGTGWVSA
jgi:hypothetical protein